MRSPFVEAAFMDTGRPALVVPYVGGSGTAARTDPGRLGRLARFRSKHHEGFTA